jgi:deazaflavin-dependent oxidoreductase (nitroreductase family)
VTDEPEVLYLTTVGRVSGSPQEIEIWFTRRGRRYYLIAEHGERASWVRNVIAEPSVRVRLGDTRFAARARVVDAGAEAELHRAVQRLSESKYGWGDGLVVELVPDAS